MEKLGALKIKNTDALATSGLRKCALEIAEAGLASIDTRRLIRDLVRLESGCLCVGHAHYSIETARRIFVVGIGKCSIAAAEALEDILGDRLAGGIALDVAMPNVCTLKKIQCFAGTHPMPSEMNMAFTRQIVALLETLTEDDLAIIVVSGGGSALLCLPEEGNICVEESMIVRELIRAGADIHEVNAVRKHMSRARGGYLAFYAYPSRIIALIFSDIPGNDISFVASGPTVRDLTTREDAERVLQKYQALRLCGLEQCGLIETPKDEKYFKNVTNILIASNAIALEAMTRKAGELGFAATVVTQSLEGEARDVGASVVQRLHVAPRAVALLYGGETTVTVSGRGRGGRNQELALAALRDVRPGELVMSLASDGRDNSEYAGALADTATAEKANRMGIEPKAHLAENDATPFFELTGDFIQTGDTGSNVSDLIIALKE